MTQIYNYFWGFRNSAPTCAFSTCLTHGCFPHRDALIFRPGTLALPPSSEKSGTLIPVLPDNDAPWPIEPIMTTWLWVIIVTWKHPETKVSQLHLSKIQHRATREKYPSQKGNKLPSKRIYPSEVALDFRPFRIRMIFIKWLEDLMELLVHQWDKEPHISRFQYLAEKNQSPIGPIRIIFFLVHH